MRSPISIPLRFTAEGGGSFTATLRHAHSNELELADSTPRRLWDAALYELHKRLMAAVDSLNARWGKDTVRCGLFPNSGAWRTRFARRSPNYTTDWRQLMTAS